MVDLADIWLAEDGRPIPGESAPLPPPPLLTGPWINIDWDVFSSADSATLNFQNVSFGLQRCNSTSFEIVLNDAINLDFDIDIIARSDNGIEVFLIDNPGDITPISNKIVLMDLGVQHITDTLTATAGATNGVIYMTDGTTSVLTQATITNLTASK